MTAQPVALVGVSICGGVITGPGPVGRLTNNGVPVALVGDAVAAHEPFTGLHNDATMATGSPTLKVNGIPVCRVGDLATCGHSVTNGSADFFA